MDIASTKLELIDQLMSINDEKILRKVASFFKQEIALEEDVVTAEDLAELDKRRARRQSGESKGIPAKDSIQQLRAAQAKDEAA
jgi:hypothetical protein